MCHVLNYHTVKYLIVEHNHYKQYKKRRTETDLWGSLVCGANSSVGLSNCLGIDQLLFPAGHKQYHVTATNCIFQYFIRFTQILHWTVSSGLKRFSKVLFVW